MSKLLYSVQSVFALKGFNTYLKAYAVLERIYLKIVKACLMCFVSFYNF